MPGTTHGWAPPCSALTTRPLLTRSLTRMVDQRPGLDAQGGFGSCKLFRHQRPCSLAGVHHRNNTCSRCVKGGGFTKRIWCLQNDLKVCWSEGQGTEPLDLGMPESDRNGSNHCDDCNCPQHKSPWFSGGADGAPGQLCAHPHHYAWRTVASPWIYLPGVMCTSPIGGI